MDAYVLGRHEGDLPTHILGAAGHGRVRAMGQLEGSPHTVFVAVDGETPEALEEALAAVRAAGVAAEVSLTLNPDGSDVSALIPLVIHIPAHMPPWERLIFIYVEAEAIAEAFEAAVEALGREGVAVAGGSDGKFLLEIGGNDTEAVEAVAASFAAAHAGAVVARVAAGGLSYA